MTDDPIVLDKHRGADAQRAIEIRRHLHEVQIEQEALRKRRAELETLLAAASAVTRQDAAERARYLITLFAATPEAQQPGRQELVAAVRDDLRRLFDEPTESVPHE